MRPALLFCSTGQPDPIVQGTRQMAEISHAFLLRCWQELDGDGKLAWRFSLTLINEKREKKGFLNLEALVAHLQQFLAAYDLSGLTHDRTDR